jgi:ubiquinone/menaquinone biosynthesis C-methylase UbiE
MAENPRRETMARCLLRKRHCESAYCRESLARKRRGVDVAPAQVTFARQHRAHPNVALGVANAMALPFEDESFDVVTCGLGLNYIPEPNRALDEIRRVIRAPGIVAAYVWDHAEGLQRC